MFDSSQKIVDILKEVQDENKPVDDLVPVHILLGMPHPQIKGTYRPEMLNALTYATWKII